MSGEIPEVGPPDEAARSCFGDRLPLAEAYARALADGGITRGLIGPREVPRLWQRHLVNCAVVESLIPHGAVVVDVGSGAGLPGIPLAIARPDLEVILLEPLLRRTTWLEETVSALGLDGVTVRRGRAEESAGTVRGQVVTARAVADLGRLAAWCAPLLDAGGSLMALKGDTAEAELAEHESEMGRLGYTTTEVVRVGGEVINPPTTVVRAHFGGAPEGPADRAGVRRRARSARPGGRARAPRRGDSAR